jgi:hypothetical protein
MHRRCLLAEEIPRAIVGSGCLGDLIVWPWLDRMDEIWELDGILNEEDWNVVSDNV